MVCVAIAAFAVPVVARGATAEEASLSTCAGLIARAAAPAVVAPVASPSPAATGDGARAAPAAGGGGTGRAGSANRRSTVAASRPAAAGPQPVDARAQPAEAQAELVYAFGDDREPLLHRQAFRVPAGMPIADVQVTIPFADFEDTTTSRPLPPGHLRAQVHPRGPGRLVTVAFCVDPMTPEEMPGGTYLGTALVGAGDRQTAVTLSATVQDDRWYRVILAALIGLVGGLWVKLFADTRSDGLPNTRNANLRTTRTLVAVGAGLVTAFYSYRTIYADDPTFVASLDNLWRVTAEVFAGALAAKGLTDLAGPLTRDRALRRGAADARGGAGGAAGADEGAAEDGAAGAAEAGGAGSAEADGAGSAGAHGAGSAKEPGAPRAPEAPGLA